MVRNDEGPLIDPAEDCEAEGVDRWMKSTGTALSWLGRKKMRFANLGLPNLEMVGLKAM
jgi:hypothetical protein